MALIIAVSLFYAAILSGIAIKETALADAWQASLNMIKIMRIIVATIFYLAITNLRIIW